MAKQHEEETSLFESFDFEGFDEDTEFKQVSVEKDETDDDDDSKEKSTDFEEEVDDVFLETIDDDSSDKKKVTGTKKETTEEEVVEEIDDKKKETPSDNNSSSSFLQVLAKSLYEEGVLSSFDENTKIEKATDFIDLINSEISTNIEAYKNDLPDEIKTLIEVYEEGVPLNELLNLRSKKIEYAKIDADKLESNDDLMKQLIREDMKLRGYDDEEITEEIKDIFALDKQEARAKKALGILKKKQEDDEQTLITSQKARQDEEIKKRDDSIKQIKKSVDDTKEFAGIELSKQHKKEAFDLLMKPVAEVGGRPVNQITKTQMENPVEFQKNLAMAWTLTKGFTDWTIFGKVTKSKAMSELEEAARKAAEKVKPGTTVKSNFDEEDTTPGSFLKNLRL